MTERTKSGHLPFLSMANLGTYLTIKPKVHVQFGQNFQARLRVHGKKLCKIVMQIEVLVFELLVISEDRFLGLQNTTFKRRVVPLRGAEML